jgi:hypothetical protein
MTGIPEQPSKESIKNDPKTLLALVLITLVGGFIRLVHVVGLDFPLNDGGFFYQAILDLQRANYALPAYTSYNLRGIPFAYPPLAFYIGGAISDVLGLHVLDIVRMLPAIISIFTIPAFILLCGRMTRSNTQVIFGTFAFTFLPTSFDWLIVGGGLTRSFGYLFAILTLWQVHVLFSTRAKRNILLTILFASLTILSHPGTAWFAVYSTAIILVFHINKDPKWWVKSILVALGVALFTAPWWLTVLSRNGLGVLTAPFQTEGISIVSILTPFTFLFTNEPLLDILALFGLLGVITSLRDRIFFYPTWLIAVFLFESRLGATYAVLPMSLLAGIGIDRGISPLFSSNSKDETGRWIRTLSRIFLVYFGIYAVINAYLGINYQIVSRDQREAMAWIDANTPADSQFLVLTGTQEYGIDQVSEWFPVLSGRTSLTTPQAHEWLPNQEFTRRDQIHEALQACAIQNLDCVESWADRFEVQFTHIYISVHREYVLSSEIEYQLLYEDKGGVVLAKGTSPP